MAYKCTLCSKGPLAGNSYSHSNRATRRIFRPNLRRQLINLDGKPTRTYVCTSCIRSGKAARPVR